MEVSGLGISFLEMQKKDESTEAHAIKPPLRVLSVQLPPSRREHSRCPTLQWTHSTKPLPSRQQPKLQKDKGSPKNEKDSNHPMEPNQVDFAGPAMQPQMRI